MIRPREQSITQAPDFPEWRIIKLLGRHCIGLTRSEVIRFSSLEPERIDVALERLQKVHAIEPESYVRGRLFFLIA